MKYVILILVYISLVLVHGLFFQEESQPFIDALRTKQYLWILYFFIAHIITEQITKRFVTGTVKKD